MTEVMVSEVGGSMGSTLDFEGLRRWVTFFL